MGYGAPGDMKSFKMGVKILISLNLTKNIQGLNKQLLKTAGVEVTPPSFPWVKNMFKNPDVHNQAGC